MEAFAMSEQGPYLPANVANPANQLALLAGLAEGSRLPVFASLGRRRGQDKGYLRYGGLSDG